MSLYLIQIYILNSYPQALVKAIKVWSGLGAFSAEQHWSDLFKYRADHVDGSVAKKIRVIG